MHELDEIVFAEARIINVVLVTEEHDNDSRSKRASHAGGQKWQHFREATQKQEFNTTWKHEPSETSEGKIMSAGPSDRRARNTVHGA